MGHGHSIPALNTFQVKLDAVQSLGWLPDSPVAFCVSHCSFYSFLFG